MPPGRRLFHVRQAGPALPYGALAWRSRGADPAHCPQPGGRAKAGISGGRPWPGASTAFGAGSPGRRSGLFGGRSARGVWPPAHEAVTGTGAPSVRSNPGLRRRPFRSNGSGRTWAPSGREPRSGVPDRPLRRAAATGQGVRVGSGAAYSGSGPPLSEQTLGACRAARGAAAGSGAPRKGRRSRRLCRAGGAVSRRKIQDRPPRHCRDGLHRNHG
ncbi:hypothetical protein EV657_10176 [Rhodovulum visakhapatnamense]|uniref:Uncharacterized protein n=1 Tax=Rhodovulum visakhapatnamense TaxID=364297 RepID=A0A4R8GAQ2_9RHOB|nr:hypothetical protein EV657_10176 [Rhodovulum visakhapatnamense]